MAVEAGRSGAAAGLQAAYDPLVARLAQAQRIFSVTWELTHVCNLHCAVCYNTPLSQPELTTQECLGILEQLAQSGALLLTLTGGEILTRADFFVIAEAARRLGFALVLKTNATLITLRHAERLAALNPLRVEVSLPGATARTCARMSGETQLLERVVQSIDWLQQHAVRVKLNTVLTQANIGEQRIMAALAQKLAVDYEQVVKVSASDAGDATAAGRHQLTTDQIAAALEQEGTPIAPHEWAPDERPCAVGLWSCLISPYGTVYPCVELRSAAGDLRQQRFADIWRDAPIFRQLRADHRMANLPRCRVCEIRAYCIGRCSGFAWKEHGDLFREDRVACRQAQARYGRQTGRTFLPAG